MKFFISYRRQDSAGWSGRLFDALASRYGAGSVFIDMVTIEPGVDFRENIHRAIMGSDVIIVVIGPGWLAERRIDNRDDYIHQELDIALSQGKGVLPVLVGGAAMPGEDELPPDIRAICRYLAVSISASSWHTDIENLFRTIDSLAVDSTKGLFARALLLVKSLLRVR